MGMSAFWQSLQAQEQTICKHPLYKMVELVNQLLHKTMPNLNIDITAGKTKPYCLMLSAQDNFDYFEEVINLYRIAPSFHSFEVIAFRQPTHLDKLQSNIDNQHLTLTNKDILITANTYQRRLALTLSITKPIPLAMVNHAKTLAVMLLNHVLGEYQFATRITHITFVEATEKLPAITLTEFIQNFDHLWQQTLGHTGIYPAKQHWQWLDLEIPYQHDEVTDTAIVARNESANALVSQLDFCYRLELAARVIDKQTMAKVFELEQQMNEQLLTSEDIIYCQNIYTDGIRYMSWYVKYPEQAFQQAEKIRQQFNQLDTELITEFDPTWSDYLRWVEA